MSISNFEIDLFGERLLWLIKSNNLSQTNFANKLSASPSFISDLIRGVKKPGTEILIRIKSNFDVSIDWLLFGEGSIEKEQALNVELLKAIALRVDIVKAALAGNPKAMETLDVMCPNVLSHVTEKINLSYLFDGAQISKDIDVINQLYIHFSNSSINEDLYQKIIESATNSILESPVDPLLNMKKNQ